MGTGAVGCAHGGEHPVGGAEVGERAGSPPESLGCLPAVEQAVGLGGVLGEVDVAAVGVDRDGLVLEPAQRQDRLRVLVGRRVERVDLEDVAVVALEAVGSGQGVDLLAGQPGVPRGHAAGAVGGGAGDADVLPDSVAVPVDLDDGGAPSGPGIVGQAVEVRHGQLGAEGVADLVVVDHHGAAAVAPEGAGAVVVAGGELARLERGHTGFADHLVRESLGQREALRGIGDQWAVSGLRRSAGIRADIRGCARGEQHLGAADQCHPPAPAARPRRRRSRRGNRLTMGLPLRVQAAIMRPGGGCTSLSLTDKTRR